MGSGRKRNKRCSCGSGKKYKHCCYAKNKAKNVIKPRHRIVAVDWGEPRILEKAKILPSGQVDFTLKGDQSVPVGAYCSTHYKRQKGEKILCKTPINPESLNLNPIFALKKFDILVAIDTNDMMIGDERVSVSCVVQCVMQEGRDIEIQFAPIKAFEFWNAGGNTEVIGWEIFVDDITRDEGYSNKLSVGIVTDSELGDHDMFNSGKKPLRENVYLPPNFTLIYAADKGQELTNKLVRTCDKWAGKILKRISSDGEIHPLKKVKGYPFSHCRFWGKFDEI